MQKVSHTVFKSQIALSFNTKNKLCQYGKSVHLFTSTHIKAVNPKPVFAMPTSLYTMNLFNITIQIAKHSRNFQPISLKGYLSHMFKKSLQLKLPCSGKKKIKISNHREFVKLQRAIAAAQYSRHYSNIIGGKNNDKAGSLPHSSSQNTFQMDQS